MCVWKNGPARMCARMFTGGVRARASARVTVNIILYFASSKASAKAPEKGSFPLDHFHECKTFMEKYMACLKREANAHAACREETKACAPSPPKLKPQPSPASECARNCLPVPPLDTCNDR